MNKLDFTHERNEAIENIEKLRAHTIAVLAALRTRIRTMGTIRRQGEEAPPGWPDIDTLMDYVDVVSTCGDYVQSIIPTVYAARNGAIIEALSCSTHAIHTAVARVCQGLKGTQCSETAITEADLADLDKLPVPDLDREEETTFTIWREGHLAHGRTWKACLLGVVKAHTFRQACRIWYDASKNLELNDELGAFDSGVSTGNRPTLGGRRLFETETQARLRFG